MGRSARVIDQLSLVRMLDDHVTPQNISFLTLGTSPMTIEELI
jgi:hypothetical protein